MFSLLKLSVAALCTSLVLAAPAAPADLQKRGGYWDQNGKWVDDGYWAWSHGSKDTEFVPWASSNYQSGSSSDSSSDSSSSDSSSDATSYSGNSHTGPATYYYQGGVAGACGSVNSDDSYIAAINSGSYSGSCGKKVAIKNLSSGQTITVTAADLCPSCEGDGIDLSVAAFQGLGDLGQGVINVEWHFI